MVLCYKKNPSSQINIIHFKFPYLIHENIKNKKMVYAIL